EHERKDFEDLALEPRWIALGRWTEACRLAGKQGQAGLFRDRAARQLLDEVTEPGGPDAGELDAEAVKRLRAVRAAVAAEHPDPAALGELCKNLLEKLDP